MEWVHVKRRRRYMPLCEIEMLRVQRGSLMVLCTRRENESEFRLVFKLTHHIK